MFQLHFHFILIVHLPIDSSGKLYIYHANKESKKIYFYYESKQNDRGTNVWDIKLCKKLLDKDICNNILFLHAILGCDTTSSFYSIGKGLSLKIFQQNKHL